MDLSVPDSMAWLGLVNVVLFLFFLGIGIYTALLIIKALRIYIKKNS